MGKANPSQGTRCFEWSFKGVIMIKLCKYAPYGATYSTIASRMKSKDFADCFKRVKSKNSGRDSLYIDEVKYEARLKQIQSTKDQIEALGSDYYLAVATLIVRKKPFKRIQALSFSQFFSRFTFGKHCLNLEVIKDLKKLKRLKDSGINLRLFVKDYIKRKPSFK